MSNPVVSDTLPTADGLGANDSLCETPSAACRVWAVGELRAMIIDRMERRDHMKHLCLDRAAFPQMIKHLYYRFHYHDYHGLLESSVPDYRRELYTQSIHDLDLRGAMPLLRDVGGFSDLLDAFPMLQQIRALKFKLVTPSRLIGDDTPSGYATIQYTPDTIGQAVGVSQTCPFPGHIYEAELRQFPIRKVKHAIQVVGRLDWSLPFWDGITAPKPHVTEPEWTTQIRSGGRLNTTWPMAPILCREISFLYIYPFSTFDGILDDLTTHLVRRRQAGFGAIFLLKVHGRIAELPKFLRQNNRITVFELRGNSGGPPSLAEVLLEDWDGNETVPTIALKHLTLPLRFEESPSPDLEHDLEVAIKRRSALPCFARLNRITLHCAADSETARDSSDPPDSAADLHQLAKGLVQLGGTRFKLRFTTTGDSHVEDRYRQMLQGQLSKEVIRRQEKERKKPKYTRPTV